MVMNGLYNIIMKTFQSLSEQIINFLLKKLIYYR